MSSMPGRIPPLGGLATYEEAARVGIGVDDSVALLRRYNRVLARLYEISAAFMNPTPEWEIKGALSLHLYLDSEHSQALRDRVAELRKPPHHMDEPLDPALEAFLGEALCAGDSVELLAGVYGVLRPSLLEACRTHLSRLNPVFDFPTARILKQIVEEQAQMVAWGTAALDALTDQEDACRSANDWKAHLRAFLVAAGGLTGGESLPDTHTLPTARATREFVPDLDPRRDARSGEIYNFHYRANDVYQDPEADWDERNLALMFKRFHEMDVPEMMAGLILQTKGRPWEYYRDMGRQLWDEARHSMMGEVWFAKSGVDWSRYPNHVGWSLHLNLDRTPLERHVILYYIEQSLMNGETGKRWEWLIAQKAGDPLATYFQDFDWADEVLHAQIGRRWLKPALGSVKDILEEAARVIDLPTPTLDSRRLTTPQEDWWPRFVRDVLGKDSTSIAGAENPLVPRYAIGASG
jgi:hypothetical protein